MYDPSLAFDYPSSRAFYIQNRPCMRILPWIPVPKHNDYRPNRLLSLECQKILGIPFKKREKKTVKFLPQECLKYILEVPFRKKWLVF